MPIGEIVVHNHKVSLGSGKAGEHDKFKISAHAILTDILGRSINVDKLELFNLDGKPHSHNAGRENRAVIFANSTRVGATEGAVLNDLVMGNVAVQVNTLNPITDKGIIILSDNGIPIAQYFADYNEFNILFNVFSEYDDAHKSMFIYIIKKYYELVWKVKELEHSWLHSSDKAALTTRFQARMREANERAISEIRSNLSSYESKIDDYKRQLKSTFDNMIRTRNSLEIEEKNQGNASKKLIDDLDLIANHKKIKDLHIKDGKFQIYVDNIICHDDQGRHFQLGNFRIQIVLENSDVKFFGDTPRQGYWTSKDPHPHVNGSNGRGCLGNIAGTIAELASRNEIYALALTCIDYLESANTGDPAGRKVTNWTQVDKDGNVISDPSVNGELFTVYDGYNSEDGAYASREVSEEERNTDYSFWASIGMWMNDDINEGDYFNDDEDEGDEE